MRFICFNVSSYFAISRKFGVLWQYCAMNISYSEWFMKQETRIQRVKDLQRAIVGVNFGSKQANLCNERDQDLKISSIKSSLTDDWSFPEVSGYFAYRWWFQFTDTLL